MSIRNRCHPADPSDLEEAESCFISADLFARAFLAATSTLFLADLMFGIGLHLLAWIA